jgi:hypothetical protein
MTSFDPVCVGDWTLPDEEFARTFKLPGAETKHDRLAVENPVPRDSRIRFFEEEHIYTVDDKRVPWSATGFVAFFHEEFNAAMIVRNLKPLTRQRYTRPDGSLMENNEILAFWSPMVMSHRSGEL